MRQEAYFCTVKELDKLGKNNIPQQLISHTHLIYSSPATLAFNSPGAEGFGVKHAGCGKENRAYESGARECGHENRKGRHQADGQGGL